MPKENRKRGRREEKKRKRQEEEVCEEPSPPPKRPKSQDAGEDVEIIVDTGDLKECPPLESIASIGDLPFYGLLDEGEQEYFKRADALLELNQFGDSRERDLFLTNVYEEASGKELKIANSQSCSRLMERLILLSTSSQLKALFQRFNGHFLHLVQHRFASHCCEALFLRAAPLVTLEETTSSESSKDGQNHGIYVSMENLFLSTLNELEGNLGYLMTDRFASHPLRLLLLVLSGMPLESANTSTLLQSRKKEHVSVSCKAAENVKSTTTRKVPDSFQIALRKMMSSTLCGLDTTYLRALSSLPIANPVLQLLLELELRQSGKLSAKDPSSLFRKLLPDDLYEDGSDSAAFITHLLYDTVGSRLLETIITNGPGKTFKALYKSFLKDRLGQLARNEIAAFVVVKALERLNRENLQASLEQICPHMSVLIERSRTAVIKTLIERCRIRMVDTQPIVSALQQTQRQGAADVVINLLKVGTQSSSMAEDRRKQIENQDVSKVHGSLLAQVMLEAQGPLRDMIMDGILALDSANLLILSKDRAASRVVQTALTCQEEIPKFRRILIPRFYSHVAHLAVDAVGSHVVDSLCTATIGLTFMREHIAAELHQNEALLRESLSGRAVWRNWRMDMYKTRRHDWKEARQDNGTKSGIETARERHAILAAARNPKGQLIRQATNDSRQKDKRGD